MQRLYAPGTPFASFRGCDGAGQARNVGPIDKNAHGRAVQRGLDMNTLFTERVHPFQGQGRYPEALCTLWMACEKIFNNRFKICKNNIL